MMMAKMAIKYALYVGIVFAILGHFPMTRKLRMMITGA